MIDAVVPYHQKDRDLLPWCLNGIRNNLDEVRRVLVICNKSNKEDVEREGGIFVDEDFVGNLTVNSYSHSRWPWYFQQVLKLAAADIVDTDYYLVVDSDTVFLRKVSFFNDEGRPLYAPATEFHRTYFDVFRKILGFYARREYSFTAHHMIYNKFIVKEMRSKFRPEKLWYDNIIKYLEPQPPWNSITQFNEQETYGHFLKEVHPKEVNIRILQFSNITGVPNVAMIQKLAKTYHFCSFHAWARGV